MDSKKRQIITIAGRPGCGKSTTAKGVASSLGFKHFSSGDLFRELSQERGIDVLELNLSAEKEDGIPAVDELVDARLRKIGMNSDCIVIDSRMAWHWIPESFKVFLDLDLLTAATRILAGMTPERMVAEHIPQQPDQYAEALQRRLESESRRYKKIYDADPYDYENYDLVVDTQLNNLEEVIALVSEKYTAWLKT